MRIALTGGAGIQAMSAMIYLLDQPDVHEIFVSDVNHMDVVEKRVASLGDSRLVAAQLDCTDEEAAARAFRGYDVVLNSAMVRGRFIRTTRAALAAGAHYLDMTSLGEEPLQFALHEQFERQGRTAVLDMGAAPGLSNLMAVYCMEKLDRTESIDYAWGVIDTVPAAEHTRPLYWGYGFDGIMGLVSGPSLVYENGAMRQLPPRARAETFHFKTGPQQIKGMPHREPAMLSESFPEAGLRHIMYRQAFDADSEAKYTFLRDLGFASREPIEVKGVKVAPFDVLWALLERLPPEQGKPAEFVSEGHCIARGWKEGCPAEMRLMIRTDPQSEMHRRYTARGAAGSYRTGICAAITATLLGRGLIERKGVFRPEKCVPAAQYIAEQARVGMEVEETLVSRVQPPHGTGPSGQASA